MFDKVAGIITNYVEVKKEDIKPESRYRGDDRKEFPNGSLGQH